MTLTKRDLVTRISNETGLVQQQVLDVVQRTLDYIAEALSKGDKVELRNFGVFEVKIRKARVGAPHVRVRQWFRIKITETGQSFHKSARRVKGRLEKEKVK